MCVKDKLFSACSLKIFQMGFNNGGLRFMSPVGVVVNIYWYLDVLLYKAAEINKRITKRILKI